MSLLNRYLGDAYATWLASATSCCGAQPEYDQSRGTEKPMTILHHQQPRLIPPPIPESQHIRSSSHEWMSRTKSFASRASTRGSFSVRRKLNAYNGPRRPQIGAPTDFRHVENSLPRGTFRFRPLELSIYMADNRLSPLSLSQFGIEDDEEPILSYPQPVALSHSRSESAMSNFSIPRKPLSSHPSCYGRIERPSMDTRSSSTNSAWISEPLAPRPSVPKSPSTQELMAALQEELPQSLPKARLRSFSEAPRMIARESAQLDRVKLVLQEKLELERRLKNLDNIIEERRSVYMSSRANSIYTVSEEPMPDLKTSELERLTRPRTAPAKPNVHIPVRAKSFSEASATFNSQEEELPLPPPLPLVLQQSHPPLRKKKSFSRVSSWLFPEHGRNVSVESITNTPKPVTSREGFYKCIDTSSNTRRSSVSTVSTMQSTIDRPTITTGSTTWTAESSPSSRTLRKEDIELTRIEVFGEKEKDEGIIITREFGMEGRHLRLSKVGVAF